MLTAKETDKFLRIVCKATRKELENLRERIEKEIRLSETSIKEGFEKDE